MFAVSHLYDVHIVDGPQRLHVHPADADALSAIEPGELLIRRCKCRSDHERGQRVEFAAKRASEFWMRGAGSATAWRTGPPLPRDSTTRSCSVRPGETATVTEAGLPGNE